MFWNRRRGVVRDALAGAACGLVASFVMQKAQARISRLGTPETRRREDEALRDVEPATARAAETAAHVAGRHLDARQKEIGSGIVHYAYGAAWGTGFALIARWAERRVPPVVAGVLFGAALWLVSDELLVPALRLSRAPTAYPPSIHAKSLAAHLVYGAATDASYRLLRPALH
jgi:uncharacterized membrane protein YagU involved in acid resistance